MQYLLLVNIDAELVSALPPEEYDHLMRGCLQHADALRDQGVLLDCQQLEAPATARSIRSRDGLTKVLDGPFAETKEILAGFNLIQAESMEQAVEIAQEFPWFRYGSIEVRPLHDMQAERRRVGLAG